MSAMMANFMSLPYDFKPAKFIFGFAPANVFVLNKMVHARFANRLLKGLQLITGSFSEQFHAAIGQISDRPGHLEPAGDRPDGISKADALHPARVQNAHSLAINSAHPCQCATIASRAGEKSPRRPFRPDIKPQTMRLVQSFFAQPMDLFHHLPSQTRASTMSKISFTMARLSGKPILLIANGAWRGPRSRRGPPDFSGFTLIELLVVIAIIAIL